MRSQIFFLKVYQSATIKSNTDEKFYLLTNDAKTVLVSGTLTIKFTKTPVLNFREKLDIGIEFKNY